MFDTLTGDELQELHIRLCNGHTRLFERILDTGHAPRMNVFGDDWRIIRAAMNECLEMIAAVSAELTRRHEETEALRMAAR